MDYSIFNIIHNGATAYPLLSIIAVFFATYAIFFLPLGIFLLGKKWKFAVPPIFTSACFAYVVNAIIGFFYFRSRPFVDHPVIQLIYKSAAQKSFPSDHTAIAFAIALTLFFFNKRIGYAALVCAVAIGIGRIGAGVHYPLDVLAGAIIGMCCAAIVHRMGRGY